jgi:hypothetical protein
MHVENKLVINWLNLNLSLAGLALPLCIGGQVSRIRSGSIQITRGLKGDNNAKLAATPHWRNTVLVKKVT